MTYDIEAKNAGPDSTSRGPVKELVPGRFYYILDPRPEEIEIEDIAEALSRINRWNGASEISVARHSINVARLYSWQSEHIACPVFTLALLLHDAAEAIVGDMASPMKTALRIAERYEHTAFDLVERKWELAIFHSSRIGEDFHRDQIKRWDEAATRMEAEVIGMQGGWVNALWKPEETAVYDTLKSELRRYVLDDRRQSATDFHDFMSMYDRLCQLIGINKGGSK